MIHPATSDTTRRAFLGNALSESGAFMRTAEGETHTVSFEHTHRAFGKWAEESLEPLLGSGLQTLRLEIDRNTHRS